MNYLHSRSGWAMFGTLLASLLLHAWLLFMPQIDLALFPANEPKGGDVDLVTMLKVRIAEAPAAPASASAALPKPDPKPRPESQMVDAAAPLAPPEPPPESLPQPLPQPAAEPDKVAVGGAPEPAPASTQEIPAAEPYPPLNLTVDYSLYKGKNGIRIGKVVHTWGIQDGHYVITSVVEAAGLARFLTSEMIVQTSQGRITANGLEPESYWEQRGQKAERTYHAIFDYVNKTLTYGRVAETTTVPLPPGTQDQLSFIYQFGLKAPFSGTLQFSMTSGRKLGTYNTEVVGEALIETGLGELRALHLRKVRRESSDDDVEVWLAVDHQYLPAKVRITNSDGDVLEQVVEGMYKE